MNDLSRDARKLVFRVSDKARHNPVCTVSALEILDLGTRRDCPIRVAKTKALISFAVTGKLISACVFAQAKIQFSQGAAHLPACK